MSIIIVLILAYILVCYFTKSGFFDKTVYVEVEGKKYKVLEELNNKDNSANILNNVDKSIKDLIQFIENKYTDEYINSIDGKYNQKKEILKQIKRRLKSTYSTNSLKENYPSQEKTDVSYNLNKGSTIALCLRNYKNPENFHEYNEILFVALHEIAHSINCNEEALMCGNSYGHDNMFWYIFKILLEESVDAGIYNKKNYTDDPVNYCSMDITYNPLYDKTLTDKYFFKHHN
jgi:hypothetical protein